MKARTNGIEMYYEVLGEGKPIVLLHGLGLDHSIWKEVVNAYSNQAKFIVPDLRGMEIPRPVMVMGLLSSLLMMFWL